MFTNKYLEAIKNYLSAKDMSYCNCGKPNQVGGFSCRQHCKHGKGEEANALQYGKPGPNDPRKTPAPKKDQKKGSKKNKPDSAKDDKGVHLANACRAMADSGSGTNSISCPRCCRLRRSAMVRVRRPVSAATMGPSIPVG